MYVLASKLLGLPIISLQTGQTCGVIKSTVIDAGNLEIVALQCLPARRANHSLILMIQDIRELALDCIIINSEDDLGDAEDVIRVTKLLEKPFALRSRSVVTDMGRRLGRVEDYTVNTTTYMVQKLYVRQSIIHSFLGSNLIVDRGQIVDVNGRDIVVRDTTSKATVKTHAAQISNT